MPRQRLSPSSRRAAKAQKMARWRQRAAFHETQSRQPGSFILVAPARSGPPRNAHQSELVQSIEDDFKEDMEYGLYDFNPVEFSDELASPVHSRNSQRSLNLGDSVVRLSTGSLTAHQPSNSASSDEYREDAQDTAPIRPGQRLRARRNIVPSETPTPELELLEPEVEPEEMDFEMEAENQVQEEYARSQSLSGTPQNQSPEVIDDEEEPNLPLQLGLHLLEFQGCSHGTHRRGNCPTHYENNHKTLEEINYVTSRLPDVLNSPEFIGAENALRNHHRPSDWQLAFEGREGPGNDDLHLQSNSASDSEEEAEDEEGEPRIKLCLSESAIRDAVSTITKFDIDSLLGFATSLAFARQGVVLDFVPQFHRNIRTNLHVTLPVTIETARGRQKIIQVKLHQIPHICMGRVLGQEDISIYLFFPKQYGPNKPTNFPGKRHGRKHRILQQWTDHILLPAIREHADSDVLQHLPSSWAAAQLAAYARSSETLGRKDTNQSQHQGQTHPFDPRTLSDIWNAVLELTQQEGLGIFQDPVLFFSSKNRKLAIKRCTLAETWTAFDAQLQFYFDMDYLDSERLFLDIGKESINRYKVTRLRATPPGLPTAYLYQPCCIKSFQENMSFGESKSKVKADSFHTAMMRDAIDATFEPKRGSLKHLAQWIYSQFYGSYKELFDAGKTKPFHGRHLSKLTWDPKVFEMLEHTAGATTAKRRKLESAYLESKRRLARGLKEALARSYGVREEHRISLRFLLEMMASLAAVGKWDQPAVVPEPGDAPYWQLATQDYLSFIAHNANKFLLLFEWILTRNATKQISYEHCKVLTMLLQAAQDCYDSSALGRRKGLYQDAWLTQRGGRQLHGMGLQKTLQADGYGWFLSRIDWETLEFRNELRESMSFNRNMLQDTYRRRGLAVRSAKDDLQFVEAAEHWLRSYSTSAGITAKIGTLLAMVVVQHFRKEIFHNLKDQLKPEHRDLALAGQVALCPAALEQIFEPPERHHICNAAVTKIQSVRTLVDLLWDSEDGYSRKRWSNRSYRYLYESASQMVRKHVGPEPAAVFQDVVKRLFVVQTWMVPCINQEQFWRRNSHGEQMWLSLSHSAYQDEAVEAPAEDAGRGWMGETIVPCGHLVFDEPLRLARQRGAAPEWMYQWKLHADNRGREDRFHAHMMDGVPPALKVPAGLEVDFARLDSVAIGLQFEAMWIEEEGGLEEEEDEEMEG